MQIGPRNPHGLRRYGAARAFIDNRLALGHVAFSMGDFMRETGLSVIAATPCLQPSAPDVISDALGHQFAQLELRAKIVALREKQDWHRELLGQLAAEQKQVSVTDPDTRKMPTAQGNVVGYNAQVAVDAKHKLIAADDVTNEGTDLRQLADVSLAAQANLELERAEVMADAGYYNASEVSRCVERGLTPFIPKADIMVASARSTPPQSFPQLRLSIPSHLFSVAFDNAEHTICNSALSDDRFQILF
jgi:hypothetical protein